MVTDKGIDGNCPNCGSSSILAIIIDGHPTLDGTTDDLSRFGSHHVCSQCQYSPTLKKDNDTQEH